MERIRPAVRPKPANVMGRRSRPAVALWVAAFLFGAIAIGANARNALLHESAVKRASDRFEQQMRGHQAQPPKDGHDAALAAEPKIAHAPAAKTRAEADQVVRPLISSNSSITYDPFGRLVTIVDPGPVTRQFVYSGDRMREERDGSGSITKQFFDWGEIIGGTKYFYTRDHLGSITEMTDSSGNVVAQYRYDPFGNSTRIAGPGPDSDFLYAGYFYHQPSGLYITAHRFYNPKLGRWFNRDPIDDPGFALMPNPPEPTDPGDRFVASAYGQPMNPSAVVFTPLMKSARDPIMRAKIAQLIPRVPGTRMPDTNLYEYSANNPINLKDPSGLIIGSPQPGKHCPRNGGGCVPPLDDFTTLGQCLDWCYENCKTDYDYQNCWAACWERFGPKKP